MKLKSCKIDESTFALKLLFDLHSILGRNYNVSDHKNYNTELVKVSDNYIKQPFDMKTKKAHEMVLVKLLPMCKVKQLW